MRKNYYLIEEAIGADNYLCYNAFNNQFLLLNKKKYSLLKNKSLSRIKKEIPTFYDKLKDLLFIVPDNFNENEIIKNLKREKIYDSAMYQVMVNTTLDCNLNCWYCYEDLVPKSKLSQDVISTIKKHIGVQYQKDRFNILKMSFFGGEPFVNFEGIKELLDFAKSFCLDRNIELIADFTTNATLITRDHINYLKDFRCHFQITLDGNRKMHNSIKKDKESILKDTYQKTIDVLSLIDSNISNRWIAVRVNFNNNTLKHIDEIIKDINFLDRKNTYVILKKVWQVSKDKVNKELLHEAIQKFLDTSFLLDYYIMPKGSVCFAERNKHVLFNYDGKVFKCSTIKFEDSEVLGYLNYSTGHLNWDLNKISTWHKDMTPEKCEKCKWFPVCLGPCNKQIIANEGKHICTFDAMNMTTKEFLIYSFKYHLLKEELSNSN